MHRLQGRRGAPALHPAAEELRLTDAGYNAWRLASLSPFPRWALALLALLAVGAVVLAWHGLRAEASPPRRAALVGLRAASALLALFLLVAPAVQWLQTAQVKYRLAVLLDRARSMNFPVEPGGEAQRETAFRLGVNLAMYALCTDYKDDAVHLPFILRRRS